MSAKPVLDVVVDTNIIFTGGTGRYVASRKFKDAMRELGKKADVTVHIPEMVFEEALYQKIEVVAKNHAAVIESAQKIEKLVDTKVSIKHELPVLTRRLKTQLNADLRTSGFKLIKGSIPAAEWRAISLRAVRREPPFDRGDESAYRDSVICATTLEFVRHRKGRTIVFLVGDKNAHSYASKFERPAAKFFVLPSTEALSALIDQLSAENSRLLKAIREVAAKRFYFWGLDTYFIVWEIADKVAEHMGAEFHYGVGLSANYRAALSLISSRAYTEYPPLGESYKGTELLEFVPDGECKFSSKLNYVLHKETAISTTGVTLERRESEVTVNWTARADGETITDAGFGSILFSEEKKSEIFVPNELPFTTSSLLSAHVNPLMATGSPLRADLRTASGVYSPLGISGVHPSVLSASAAGLSGLNVTGLR